MVPSEIRKKFSKMTKFDLSVYIERHSPFTYVNPDHWTKAELLEWALEVYLKLQ